MRRNNVCQLRRGKDVKPKKLDDSIRLVGNTLFRLPGILAVFGIEGVRRLPGRFYALRHFIDSTISSKRTPWLFFSADFLDLIDRMVTFLPPAFQRFGDMGKRIFLLKSTKPYQVGIMGLMIVGPDGTLPKKVSIDIPSRAGDDFPPYQKHLLSRQPLSRHTG